MCADKVKNIVTLSSDISTPLIADMQYFELYSTEALNRKMKNIVLPGVYCGFEPVPGDGLFVRITSEKTEGRGAASIDVGKCQISVQQVSDVLVPVEAGVTTIIVLEANYEHGVKTSQVDSSSDISAARIIALVDEEIASNQIELCRVIVPDNAQAVTADMISTEYRANRAVGVEFSSALDSDEEYKAATPLAISTLNKLKAPVDSPEFIGIPKSPTPEQGTNSTQIANTAFVQAAITALIDGSPSALDTLKKIADAINNDPQFSQTINAALALKAPLLSPAFTGVPTAPTASQGTNNTQIATTAYVRAAISALVGSSPEALDTLNELAAALGNDPNFATTMTNALAGKQPLDATLTALAGLATGANKLPYFTGTDTVAQTDLTSVGRDILAKTSTLAVIQYLGLREIGTSGEKLPLLSTANTWSARQTFSAGITGTLTGNADTATKLKTARKIGGVAFDGSADINLPGVNIAGNQNTSGNAATATKLQTARTIGGVSFDGSANIDLPGVNKTGNQSTTGNAATATKLQTARTINGVTFDGSADITLTPANLDVYSKSEIDNKKGMRKYTLTAPSGAVSGKWYPVVFRRSSGGNSELASRVVITTASTTGNFAMNNCEFNGMVMSGGWSDRGSYAAGYFWTYQADERAIHSIISGVKDDDRSCVFYVEARAFPIQVFAEEGLSVVLPTEDYTLGQSTYKWGVTDPAAESTNVQTILDFKDGRGFYCSHPFISSLSGNAATATKLATARKISGVAFDGSADITLTAEHVSAFALRATGAYADSDGAVPWNAESGAYNVTRSGDSYLVANFYTGVGSCRTLQIRAHYKNGGLFYRSSRDGYGFEEDWTQIYTKKDSIPGVNTTGNQNTTGNAATATKLQTARTIGGVSFDGSANINLPGVNTIGNQSTTGNAATATKLQTARTINGVSFDGSANISLSPANIGCPASPTGWLTTGSNGASITTAQLVTLLQNNGAFNTKAWVARCAWAYANSASIPDSETGCGIIPLAGAVIEVFSNSASNYTIRITTATTTSVSGALTNAEFIYVFNGTAYSPGWRRVYNTKNKPTASDVGAYTRSESDSRYALKTACVTSVRMGAVASYSPPNNETSWTQNLGSGLVMTGIIVQETGKASADNIGGIYYRPVQYCINGTWYTAASV
ncbi:phage tail protein [Escherichia coli]